MTSLKQNGTPSLVSCILAFKVMFVLLLLIAMFSPAKRAVAARNRRGPGRRFAPLVPNAGDCDDCYYES